MIVMMVVVVVVVLMGRKGMERCGCNADFILYLQLKKNR